jgi:hypothetical protein
MLRNQKTEKFLAQIVLPLSGFGEIRSKSPTLIVQLISGASALHRTLAMSIYTYGNIFKPGRRVVLPTEGIIQN